ncbi:MAG: SCO family protein [Burkholderiales bacterium]
MAVLLGCDSRTQESFKSTDITGADFGRDFSLADHNGAPKRLADYQGKIVVIFFGFTHCPDVCPTVLAQMAKMMKEIGPAQGDRVQVLFVSVDPQRDKPEVLKGYVTAFHPSFVGLTGSEEAINKTAKEFKLVVMKTAETSPGNYSVDHSTQTFVYDTKGRIRLFVSHSKIGEALAHDIAILLKQG